MFSDFCNCHCPFVISLFIKVKIFGTFFRIATFIFACSFSKLNPFTLTLQINSRSNSAIAPKMVSMNRPCGVEESSCSFKLRTFTSFFVKVSTIFNKSVVERARRENSETINSSPSRKKIHHFVKFGTLGRFSGNLIDKKFFDVSLITKFNNLTLFILFYG